MSSSTNGCFTLTRVKPFFVVPLTKQVSGRRILIGLREKLKIKSSMMEENMEEFEVKQIKNLLYVDLTCLVKESKEEGFRFLERLVKDYKNGTNNFNKPGESLFGAFNKEGVVIAIGGLNIDPFSNEQIIGRLRRFYVSKDYRRSGIGRLLLENIICDAKTNYKVLVLHTDTEQADKFYTSLGFLKENRYPKSTHCLNL